MDNNMCRSFFFKNSQCLISLAFCFLTLTVNTTFARTTPEPPPQIKGEYVFRGQVKKMAILHLERVYTLFEEGQNRLQELTQMGYICESYGGNWTACHKIRHDLELPDAIVQQAQQSAANQFQLRFGAVTASPQLVHSSEFQWEWNISQKVELNGKVQHGYRLMHMEHVEKLLIQGKEFLLNRMNDGSFTFSNIQSITQDTADQTGYFTYYLELQLLPEHFAE